MLLPDVFKKNDLMFDDFRFNDLFKMTSNGVMKTDIKDLGDKLIFAIDMPGFDKKDISLSLEDDYLVLSAKRQETKEEKDADNNYIKRERYCGSCSRSYFVGDDVTLDDVKASFDNGVLNIEVAMKEPVIEEQASNLIEIK